MTPPNVRAVRGEVWSIRFDPSEGDEIRKIRPAVVMTVAGAGRIRLHIVVPITAWHPEFADHFWMTQILPKPTNGLSKESGADAFQVKSVSVNKFQRKLGVLSEEEIENVALAISLCIGYKA
jgi:mRNA interferase MazF